jgi:hypothetical protein
MKSGVSWRQDYQPPSYCDFRSLISASLFGARRNVHPMSPLQRRMLATFIGVAVFWSLALRFNDVSGTKSRNQSKFDIVLSYYDENTEKVRNQIEVLRAIPAFAELSPRVIIYIKGPVEPFVDGEPGLEVLRNQLGADIVRTLPNYGRESHTFLTHIVNYWDDLATQTLFGQGRLHDLDLITPRIETHFNTSVAAMSFAEYSSCECEFCDPLWGSPKEGFKRVPQLYTIFNQEFCPSQGVLLSYRGQFIVHRDRIYRHARERYQWLLEIMEDMSHDVNGDNPSGSWYRHDNTLENPFFGHIVERAWLFIFGCNDLRLAAECETMDIKSASTPCACYLDDVK